MTAALEPAVEGLAAEPLEGGFSRRALGWIIGSVAVSFVAAILLGVYGRDLDRRPSPAANTFSDSALGHRAFAGFLRSMGLGVVSRQNPARGGIGPRRPLVLAEPDPSTMRRDGPAAYLEKLRQEARDRTAPLVLVLPKWRAGAPRKDKPEWLATVEILPHDAVQRGLDLMGEAQLGNVVPNWFRGRLRCTATWSPGDPAVEVQVDLGPAQFLAGPPELQPVVNCPGGLLVARRPAAQGGPQIVVVSDPDLLNNHGLGQAQNAAVIYQVLTRGLGATGVVFDETIHGFNRDQGLLAEALSFPVALSVLQVLVLLGVVLWAGMGRFGKPLPSPAPLAAGKEVLIDNTAQLLASGGHTADCLARYFRQTTRAVAAHYFLPADLPDGERLGRLQRITDARGGALSLAELERSLWQLPDGRPGEERAAAIARALHDWRVETTNGHRESP